MTVVDNDNNQPTGNYGPMDGSDWSQPEDVTQEALQGEAAGVVRTYLRPLLPGGYDVERYTSARATATADAAGACTVWFPDVLPGSMWLVDRVGLVASAGGWGAVAFYVGDPAMRQLVDLADAGGPLDVADETSPIVVGAGVPLVAVAAGMTPAAELTVHVQYRLAVAL